MSSPTLKASALAVLDNAQFRQEKPFGDPVIGNDLLERIANGDGKQTVLCLVCWRGGMKTCRLHSGGSLSGYCGNGSHFRSLSKAALPHLRMAGAEDVAEKLVSNLHEYQASKGKGKGKSSFEPKGKGKSSFEPKGKGKGDGLRLLRTDV